MDADCATRRVILQTSSGRRAKRGAGEERSRRREEQAKRGAGEERSRRREEQAKRGAGEERFLSAQADPFAGAKGQEKIGLLRSK
jgi:hypothetical protein